MCETAAIVSLAFLSRFNYGIAATISPHQPFIGIVASRLFMGSQDHRLPSHAREEIKGKLNPNLERFL